jgi:hypothetical protein
MWHGDNLTSKRWLHPAIFVSSRMVGRRVWLTQEANRTEESDAPPIASWQSTRRLAHSKTLRELKAASNLR